jgi:DNA-binding helix-hairpin-helix protein with protein kinase domain
LSGHFHHGRKHVPWSPKPVAPPFEILHPTLRQLSIRCFEDGHHNPRVRPDAQTWAMGVRESESALVEYKKNPRHLFGNHLRTCPWCERSAQFGGLDPFPLAGSSQPRPRKRPTRKLPARPSAIPAVLGFRQPGQMQPIWFTISPFASRMPLLGGYSRLPVGFIIFLIIIGIFLMLSRT